MKRIDLLEYFKRRINELFNSKTLDSYRIRYNNTPSILKELKDLLISRELGNVKNPQSIVLVIEETLQIIEDDDIFDFSSYNKKLFTRFLNESKSTIEDNRFTQKENQLILILDALITDNKESYIKGLWDCIEKDIFTNPGEEITEDKFSSTIERLDWLITSLAREILNCGFSKRSVHNIVNKYKKNFSDYGKDEESAFTTIKEILSGKKKRFYQIVLSLYGIRGSDYDRFGIFRTSVSEADLDIDMIESERIMNFLKGNINRRFYIHKCEATDEQTAIKEASRQLHAELDRLHTGIQDMVLALNNSAVVLDCTDNKNPIIFLNPSRPLLDGSVKNNPVTAIKYKKILEYLNASPNVDSNVKIRIECALRHLRVADNASEIEQKFINFWIALEFIFSSPLVDENTFRRIKSNLTNILAIGYIERNIRHIENVARDYACLGDDESISISNIDEIFNKVPNLLIKYRLKEYKSKIFGKSDKREKYVKRHRKNIERHITRIYHVRNELIHEAAIKQDIEALTSNLRYYLIYLLNQMIMYFYNISKSLVQTPVTIDRFFHEYQIMYDNIAYDWDINKFRSVPLYEDLTC